MPIQTLLPDGNVRIFNSITGQTKDVKPDELATYNPKMIPEYQSLLKKQQEGQAQQELVKSGNLDFGEYAKTDPTGAQSLIKGGFTPKSEEQIKADQTKAKSRPDAEALFKGVENLKQKAQNYGVEDFFLSRLSGGNLGTDADIFDQSKKLLGQTVAKLYENGRLSDKDRDFYQKEILNVGGVGSQKAINRKLDNLRDDILLKAGYKAEDFGGKTGDIQGDKKGQLPQIVKNAGQDIKGIINGVANLPSAALQSLEKARNGTPEEQLQAMHDLSLWGFGENVVKGYISELNQLAGEPLKGGDVVGRAVNRAYEKPVTTALDLLPVAGRAKGALPEIGAGGKASAAVESISGKASTLKTGAKSLANDVATNAFASNFTIPSKLASRIKIDDVAAKMIENGHKGSLDELGQVADQVTGQNGIFPKLNREAISQIKKPIPYQDAIDTGTKALDDIPELAGTAALKKHKQIIRDLVKPEGGIGNTSGLSAIDTIRELEKRGYKYKNSSTKLSPNPLNEQIGDAYIRAADDLSEKLNGIAGEEDVVAMLKTPENIQAIEVISPKLAEEFTNAKTIKDLRKIQSPYVRLNQAIGLTEDASNTAFSKVSGNISRGVGAAMGGAVGSVLPGVGTLAGAAGGALLAPVVEPVVKAVLPRITTKAAQIIRR